MADQKITDFSADASPAAADLIVTAKSPFGAGSNRKVTLANLKALVLATPTITGHPTVEGVTATGATGTGKIVFDTAPTIATPTLGSASTQNITCTGRLVVRTFGSDPQHVTPGSRPAGTTGEIGYYNGKLYFCTNGATPTYEIITSS